MSEKLSRERLAAIIRMIVSARGPAVADEIADHIAALEAENERLRAALLRIIGLIDVHARELEIAVDALAALEVGE